MIQPESYLFFGCVEQAVTGGIDPLSPPISVSRNGSLAKWRDKLHFLDLRVNDPGLRQFREPVHDMLKKAASLSIEVFVTLPELQLTLHPVPAEAWMEESKPERRPPSLNHTKRSQGSVSGGPPRKSFPGKQKEPEAPKKKSVPPAAITEFKSCYLAVPNSADPEEYNTLSAEDCFPIMKLAAENGVSKIVVPVSEPGLFLDPVAANEFEEKLGKIAKMASALKLEVAIRNGGLSEDLYRRWKKRFACKLALNVGTSHLEQMDPLLQYQAFRDDVALLIVHQVLPGTDRIRNRKANLIRAQNRCLQALENVRASDGLPQLEVLDNRSRFRRSYKKLLDSSFNHNSNLGLFQSGDLNIVPIIKEIRHQLEKAVPCHVLVESAPNVKNTDFIFQYISSGEFPGAF